MTKSFIILFFGLLFFGCSKSLKIADASEAQKLQSESNVVCYLERTPCYGKCPTFKMSIHENGLVIYEGIRFVENIGFFYGSISEKQIEKIYNKAESIKFYEMADEYPVDEQAPQDIPETITMIVNGERSKKIRNKNFQSPESLNELENFIDATVKEVDWQSFDSKMAE